MKSFKYIIPGMVLAMGVFFTSQNSRANPDYTKRTGKKCLYCHIGEWNSGKYTEAGQYFKGHNTLKGYVQKEPPPREYGQAKEKNVAKL